MTHELDLIFTLTAGLSVALLFGYLTQRLGLSPIVGYLMAGVIVGPFTPGYVADPGIAQQLAEVGVILLMFGVGLQFHVQELWAVRRIAIPGAVLQIAIATLFGWLAGSVLGWSPLASIVFGLAISVASTVVLVRVLSDAGVLHTPAGHVAIGWLVVEDLFTVLVLVLLPAFAFSGGGELDWLRVGKALGLSLLKLAVLLALTVTIGRRAIPKLLEQVARTRSRELFTLSVLVLALGIAVAAAELFGASMALGAFIAGVIVGQSSFSARAASDALPLRDAFAVLFFVSMGMLFEPGQLLANGLLTGMTLGIVLLVKPLAAIAVVIALRHAPKVAASVAIALAQIGEFSFILAGLGEKLNILPKVATQALVAASIASITLNPLLFRLVTPLARLLPDRRRGPAVEPVPVDDGRHRAVVIGYGPVGRTLARLLREHDIEPVIVELNHDTVAQLTREGARALYGDAAQPETLRLAGIEHAQSLIFTSSSAPEPTIRVAKELNPGITVMTRTNYVAEAAKLREAGAGVILAAEAEIALAMAERVLIDLGATDDQLDRARDRVRREMALSY